MTAIRASNERRTSSLRVATFLATALLGFIVSAAVAQERAIPSSAPHTSTMAFDASGSAYIAETVSVDSERRDAFVQCLRESAWMRWTMLRHEGLLADVSVFETIAVRFSNPGSARWSFLVLSHLARGVQPQDVFAKAGPAPQFSIAAGCTTATGIVVRRVEVLRPTPKSSYPRASAAEDRVAVDRNVRFIVEYIAVNEDQDALAQYRESMAQNMGAAMGLMIPEGTFFEFKALETAFVMYSAAGSPAWNQIHIRGFYPDKGPAPAESPIALRRVNPAGGAGFFASLNKIRTKTREDEARQLFELAVR